MKIIRKNIEDREADNLGQIIFSYLPYWPLFLTLFVLFIGSAWLYLKFIATPLYESSSRILIKDEKKGVEEAKELESLDVMASNKTIENEMEVIKSNSLVNEVVYHLDLYAPVFEEE